VRIESKPLEGGRSVMKSNEIDFHGLSVCQAEKAHP
jgi:hypothetical protein